MSVSSGFFNSLNGDRKYNAAQMSAIFDGLIIDGVFASIGTAFAVKAAGRSYRECRYRQSLVRPYMDSQ